MFRGESLPDPFSLTVRFVRSWDGLEARAAVKQLAHKTKPFRIADVSFRWRILESGTQNETPSC